MAGQRPSTRNYKREYRRDHASPTAKKHRAMRNSARRMMKASGANVAGKDVGHVKALRNGGTNSRSNLRVQSVSYNRGKDNAATHKRKKK